MDPMLSPRDRNSPTALERSYHRFVAQFNREPTLMVSAPGRVNLIGDHTDYNDGFVLPVALPHCVAIAAEPRSDNLVSADSEGFGSASFSVAGRAPGDNGPSATEGWSIYIQAMAWAMARHGLAPAGWQGCLATDVPVGAGLSSSAALEVAAGLVYDAISQLDIDAITMARLGRQVETHYLGLPSGIMDQLTSAAATANAAVLIDCRSLELQSVAIPDEATIVVMDTGTRRALVDSQFAQRQQSCVTAAQQLGVSSLRDANLDDVERLADPILRRRARHVVTENQRTLDAADSLRAGDLEVVGQLMNQSHHSLANDYEVSGPALDAITTLARQIPGVLGARMTGGGFAGVGVALVQSRTVSNFVARMTELYVGSPNQPSTVPVSFIPIMPGSGAQVLRPIRRRLRGSLSSLESD